MPYAPSQNDNSGEIMLAGAQAQAQGIQQAGQAIAGGIKDYHIQQAELDQLQGKVQALHNAGVITDEDLQKFQSGSLSNKRAIASQAETAYGLHQSALQMGMEQQKVGIEQQKNTITQATLDRVHPAKWNANSTPVTDPETGRVIYYIQQTSPGQMEVVPQGPKMQLDDPGKPPQTTKINGIDYYYSQGTWKPVVLPFMNQMMASPGAASPAYGVPPQTAAAPASMPTGSTAQPAAQASPAGGMGLPQQTQTQAQPKQYPVGYRMRQGGIIYQWNGTQFVPAP